MANGGALCGGRRVANRRGKADLRTGLAPCRQIHPNFRMARYSPGTLPQFKNSELPERLSRKSLDRWLPHGRSTSERQPRDATDRAAKQHVGNDCQGHCRKQQFQQVDSAVNDELVDHIQNSSEQENLSDVLPSLAQQLAAVGRIPEQRREKKWPILTGVLQPGMNREDCGNGGLYDQPQVHRPGQPSRDIVP